VNCLKNSEKIKTFLDKFLNSLEKIKNSSKSFIGVLCHQNADPDTLGSAIALKELLESLKPQVNVVIFSDSINNLSSYLKDYTNSNVTTEFIEKNLDLLFIVDANNLVQLGSMSPLVELAEETVIIDHHEPHSQTPEITDYFIILEELSSTSEIIYNLFKMIGVNISPKSAFALMAGIIFDTRRFSFASSNTFSIISDLIQSGANYDDALSLFVSEMDISEKIARLKASQRATIKRINDLLILTSEVSTYEASAARALIELGADISIVIADKGKNEVRASARANPKMKKIQDFNLGKIMET
jgi:phosphoesterase RecJ-like protein